jgi:hypothetical protein
LLLFLLLFAAFYTLDRKKLLGIERDGDGSIFLNRKPSRTRLYIKLKNRTIPYLNRSKAILNNISLSL